jgi:hypothetical protein
MLSSVAELLNQLPAQPPGTVPLVQSRMSDEGERNPVPLSQSPESCGTDSGVAERGPSLSCLTAESRRLSRPVRADLEESFICRIQVSRPNTTTGKVLRRVHDLYEVNCPTTGRRKHCNATTCDRCGPIIWTRRAVLLGHLVATAPGQLVGKLPLSAELTPSQIRRKMHRWQRRMVFHALADLQLAWVVERNTADPSKLHVHYLGILTVPLLPFGIPTARRLAYLERLSAWAWDLPSAAVSALTPAAVHGLCYVDSVPGQDYLHQSTEEAAINLAVYQIKNYVLGTPEQRADHARLNGSRQAFAYSRPILGDHTWESMGL